MRQWWPLGLFSVLWLDLIRQLSYQWSNSEQYAYGWFVPFLALGLFWRRWPTRPQVSGFRFQVSGLIAHPSSRFLLSAFCFLLLLLLLPLRVVHEINQDWPLITWPLTLIVVALSLYAVFLLGGWTWVTHFAFPVCFILVAVPWPYRIEHGLTQGLMRGVTALTVIVLGWVDILASQHGNVIEISTGAVGINEACSGIRSFQSMIMGALFLGELYRLRWPHRLALIGSGVVVAFGLNVVRTFILTWCASDAGIELVGKWHDPAGLSIFLASFACLWLLARRLEKHCAALDEADAPGFMPTPERSAEGEVQSPTSQVQSSGCGVQSLKSQVQSPGSGVQRPTSKVQSPNSAFQVSGFRSQPLAASLSGFSPQPFPFRLSAFRFQPSALRFLKAVGCWAVCVLGLTELWYVAHERAGTPPQRWSVTLPATNSTFQTVALAPQVLASLKSDDITTGTWKQGDGSDWTVFFLRWNPKSVPSVIRARGHRPESCLPGAGFREISNLPVEYFDAGPLKLPFRRYSFEANRQLLYVFFCLWQDGDEDQPAMSMRNGVRVLGVAERVQLLRQGRRRLGQQTLEIVVSGCESFQNAEQQVRSRLLELIRIGERGKNLVQNPA